MSNKKKLYNVWSNKTDEFIACAEPREVCAKLMNISPKTFYSLVSKSKKGIVKCWHIEYAEDEIGDDNEDQAYCFCN